MASPIQEATELVEDLFRSGLKILKCSKISCDEQEQYIAINNYKIYKNKNDLDFTVINSHTGEQSIESSLYHCVSYIICNEIKTCFETRCVLNALAVELTHSMQEGNNNG